MSEALNAPAEVDQPGLREALAATTRSIFAAQRRAEIELHAAREALEARNAALAAANSILEATLDATPVGVVVASRAGRVMLRNRRFDGLWGLERLPGEAGELEGLFQALAERLEEPQRFAAWVQQVRAQPEREHELDCRSAAGRHLHCRAIPQRQDGVTVGVVYNWLDVTERAQAEALRAELRAAELAARGRSQFLARASHELRTPLNAVLGFSQLLQRNRTVIADAVISRQVGHIRTAGDHLRELMDDLLQITRLETGAMMLAAVPLDLADLARETLALMQPQAQAREVVLQARSEGAPCVLGDRTAVRRVLMNLVSNGVKYNRPRGEVSLVIGVRDGRGVVEVLDTGTGLAPEQIEHLFEPFNRLGAERSGVEGTGLGLAITHQLVAAMNGTIEVRSGPGAGSAFTLLLPLAPAPGTAVAPAAPDR